MHWDERRSLSESGQSPARAARRATKAWAREAGPGQQIYLLSWVILQVKQPGHQEVLIDDQLEALFTGHAPPGIRLQVGIRSRQGPALGNCDGPGRAAS